MKKLVLLLAVLPQFALAQGVYPYFPPPNMTYSGTQWGPLSSMPSVATSTVVGNYSGSTAAPSALNPLAIANMQSAVISVDVASFAGNLSSLSGLLTIDGGTVVAGQSVLVAAQSTSSQNGIYIAASGAWSRAANFPNGYVISANCDVQVFVATGAVFQGHTFSLGTSLGAITIGTTAQSWSDRSLQAASPTRAGITWATGAAGSAFPAALWAVVPVANANDCVSTNDTAGNLLDLNGSPCAYADSNFNYAASEGNATPPTVTGSGCSLAAGGLNNSGAITATGIDTCTLTFGGSGGFPHAAPFCAVAGESATVLPFISTPPTETAVIFKTAAAGRFEYVCM